ncbi:hypothetical protein CJO81_25685 (plasmid) [Ralstonia solanacearum]|nr:hypothetical protein AC251_25650 [Ralstonia pseudosolanacearum]ARS58654.1 hypothetical protein BC427_21135 [Ralstonia solanacearum FJAT-91]AVV67650.1 hypothetical protein RSOE_06725 [Ralstonia solanacearum OE1-1]AXV72369.1 hypothetical protein CJO74_24515 [Ralstonia solanacearum]AST89099.1 hypothetical protein CIG66_22240 [Ralstonia pseudosolanacearum]
MAEHASCHLARKAGRASLDAARAQAQAPSSMAAGRGTDKAMRFIAAPSRKTIGDAYARRIADRPESVRCAATRPDATIPMNL